MRHGQMNRWWPDQIAGQTIPVLRFMGFPPNAAATGDIESMDLLMGQSVGLVHEIKPAALIIRDLVEGARQIIEQRLTPTLSVARRERGPNPPHGPSAKSSEDDAI